MNGILYCAVYGRSNLIARSCRTFVKSRYTHVPGIVLITKMGGKACEEGEKGKTKRRGGDQDSIQRFSAIDVSVCRQMPDQTETGKSVLFMININ